MRAKAPGRKRQIGPEPVDIHVAVRVRQRRIELGISQQMAPLNRAGSRSVIAFSQPSANID